MPIEYLSFKDAVGSDGTNTYSMTSCSYDDTCNIIKIKNTRTTGKTQFLKGFLESAFAIEFDYDSSQTLPVSGSDMTFTGTLKSGKTFVITGVVEKVGLKASGDENWKGAISMPGTLTTQP